MAKNKVEMLVKIYMLWCESSQQQNASAFHGEWNRDGKSADGKTTTMKAELNVIMPCRLQRPYAGELGLHKNIHNLTMSLATAWPMRVTFCTSALISLDEIMYQAYALLWQTCHRPLQHEHSLHAVLVKNHCKFPAEHHCDMMDAHGSFTMVLQVNAG